MRKYLIYLCICMPMALISQVSTKVVVLTDTIQIGEVAKIQYQISSLTDPTELNFVIENFDTLTNAMLPLDDVKSDGDFEITDLGDWDIVKRKIDSKSLKWERMNQAWILQNTIEVQCWMAGVYLIPPIHIDHPDTTTKISILPDYLFVSVPDQAMQQDTAGNLVLLPNKDILLEEKTWEDALPYIYGLLMLFLAFVGYRLYKKYAHKEEEDITLGTIKVIRPADVIALEKLNKLEDQKLWQQDNIKEYQSKLTYIIREYLENRYGIKALESTTDEIKKALKKNDFDTKYELNLSEILQMADLIKFAKALPPKDIHAKYMAIAKEFVNNTKTTTKIEE